ncbi:S1C family serine protease [Nocardioides bruguierae]|uniref:Trypsin-like peptidase domain-containing protein n=1 Tax=Nocardioides bruguierae TaxID=2945102 RepID=A0A9X2D5V6_9ACTN|nr:trypsin-like peptidase domain-containing protein [Nocardioides bruguierae]MCM0619962.1 trypsin-like peptidase domain-containing protein [Nocardioides bruguierae]
MSETPSGPPSDGSAEPRRSYPDHPNSNPYQQRDASQGDQGSGDQGSGDQGWTSGGAASPGYGASPASSTEETAPLRATPGAGPTPAPQQPGYDATTWQPPVWGAQDGATATLPAQAPAAQTAPRKRRGGLAASVVALSLVLGAAAGFGGAAAWSWYDDEDGSTSTASAATSQVVTSNDTDASTIEQVASKVLPSVVMIEVVGAQESGSGSGIVLSSDGTILTNNHVVEVAGDSGSITVDFNDGSHATATIVGTDPLTDTAVIQAQGVSDLTPADIGVSSDLKVGEGVVAVGSPYGLDATVTSGIVSALERPVDVGSDDQGNATVYPAIQTDAAINPGNSGGPLVDLEGNVVGINASIQTASSSSAYGTTEEGGSIGLGFAIPIDEVWPVIQQMIDGETPTHARLGISVSDVQSGTTATDGTVTDGAQVQAVTDGSAAGSAGLQVGDIITQVDDTMITSSDSLVATIRGYRPGDEVTVTYLRDGTESTATLSLDSDGGTASS